MSDNLKWRNQHAVLLREPTWAGIAARENYKIRADLRPLFEAHPDSLDLLKAFDEKKLYREGCEFIARMTHRRAAVWWGYICLLDLFEEKKRAEGKPPKEDPFMAEVKAEAEKFGIKMPENPSSLDDIDNYCKMPEIDIVKLVEIPKPPVQDRSAIDAASAAVGAKTAALRDLIPDEVRTVFETAKARVDGQYERYFGLTPDAARAKAEAFVEDGPLMYTIDRANSPTVKKLIAMQDMLKTMREGVVAQIKGAFPEKYPATPEAARLLKAEKKQKTDNALQAIWRWIVAPDERNTTLALEAGNVASGTAEGLLAYTAAWSFGDFAPEGKITIPVPPELPGTGLNSALLMMALDQGGELKMPERYEIYFKLGMEVVYGRLLWDDAVASEKSPHSIILENWNNY